MSGDLGRKIGRNSTSHNHSSSSNEKETSLPSVFHRSSPLEGVGNQEIHLSRYQASHIFYSNQATYHTQRRTDKSQPQEIKNPQVDRIIKLLDEWTLDDEETQILTILENAENIDTILKGLESRGYLKKLFSDIHGKEHSKLIGVLAKKGAIVKPNHNNLEQIFSGTVEGGIAFSQGTWESFTTLFDSQTWVGIAKSSELVFKATNLHYAIAFPKKSQKAREQLKQIALSIKDQFVKEWQNAKSQGRESELIAKWTSQGVLDVGSMFIGLGTVTKAVKTARGVAISAKFTKLGWTLEKIDRVLNKIEKFIPDIAKKMGKKSNEIQKKVRKWRRKKQGDWSDKEVEEFIDIERVMKELEENGGYPLDLSKKIQEAQKKLHKKEKNKDF